MEVDDSYKVGSLSSLIAKKSKKKEGVKKTKGKASKTSPAKSKKAAAVIMETDDQPDIDDKLENAFNDPIAETYDETVEADENADSLNGETDDVDDGQDRETARAKHKLVKMRQKEKEETAHRTIFVGNLPITVEKKDILKHFRPYGTIETLRFRNVMRNDVTKPLKASAIKKDFHPRARSVNAYVVYEDEKSAQKATSRNSTKFLGNHIRVDIAGSESKAPSKKTSVFVGNLPYDCAEEDLWEFFEKAGEVVNVRVIRDSITRRGKGFAYIHFKLASDVPLALQLDGKSFHTRSLRVKRCVDQNEKANASSKSPKVKKQPKSNKVKKDKPDSGKKTLTPKSPKSPKSSKTKKVVSEKPTTRVKAKSKPQAAAGRKKSVKQRS